jgi:hypothetical protein
MSVTPIDERQVLAALRHIPPQRWGEILHFIDSLQATEGQPTADPAIRTGTDLRNSGLIGIWADRTDMDNGRQFARRLREQAGRRLGGGDAAGH